MHVILSLTVSESKRLIARGVAQADFVRRAIDHGTFAIGTGTTNGYIVEEITGEEIDKTKLVTGEVANASILISNSRDEKWLWL